MCLFCEMSKDNYIYEDEFVYAIFDSYPVNKGHVLIIPKEHRNNYFEATLDEKKAIDHALQVLKKHLDKLYKPGGYNIGINNGAIAGQTIMHLHVHLIPRYQGDVEDPHGGIRGVIPNKQKY